eukprot:scaffold971_cov107-Isochrysis_galbana.AAC.8
MSSLALPPLVPPLRFALVEEGLYRGAYPSLINLRFLTRLRLRTIVSLLPEPPSADLERWCSQQGVALHHERVPLFREEVVLSPERVAELLALLVSPDRGPVYLHCLDGVCVTGTIVLCLRKLQRWASDAAAAEYSRFARNGLDVPHLPPAHVTRFVSAWRPELEFGRVMPEALPRWLALPLGLRGSSLAHPVSRERELSSLPPFVAVPGSYSLARSWADGVAGADGRGTDAQRGPVGAGEGDAAGAVGASENKLRGFSNELQALALEGLTMKPGVQSTSATVAALLL